MKVECSELEEEREREKSMLDRRLFQGETAFTTRYAVQPLRSRFLWYAGATNQLLTNGR